MLVIGTFEHCLELEQSLADLEQSGVSRQNILVVPMDATPGATIKFADSLPDSTSKAFEIGIAFATASCVVGTSVGFILYWGPIIWGLIAALTGFVTSSLLYLAFSKGSFRLNNSRLPEVTVIVQCPEQSSVQVSAIMWRYKALTVGESRHY